MKLLAIATDVDADDADADANANASDMCVWVKRSGRFYNVESYWHSPEQNVGAKKEQRERKKRRRKKKL